MNDEPKEVKPLTPEEVEEYAKILEGLVKAVQWALDHWEYPEAYILLRSALKKVLDE